MKGPSLVVLPSTAWTDPELSGLDLRVLMAIAAHCRSTDRAAWPSQGTIAGVLGVTRESVCRAVGKLKARGHIEVEHVFGERGEQRSSRYYVPLDVSIAIGLSPRPKPKRKDGMKTPRNAGPRLRNAVFARDGHRCAYCGKTAGPLHVDHIVPRVKGGETELNNLTVACPSCNSSKGKKTLAEWRAQQ